MKGVRGSWFKDQSIKNEFEAFLLHINEDMIGRYVERKMNA